MAHRTEPNDAFLAELQRIVGIKYVLTETADIAPFVEDWRGYSTGRTLAVVLPANTAEVSLVMSLAARFRYSVVPQGGNTGLCQGAIPGSDGRSIVVALGRMTSIREIDKPSGILVAEAGMTLAAAQETAHTIDRRIPLRLGSEGSAQIGGLLSTNAGGTGALRYGPVREIVCGIEVVLPDGQVLNDLKALRKSNTGYDLKNLFIGAEGTLGIVTAAAIRMQPMLRTSAHVWIALSDLHAAVPLLTRLQDRFDTAVQAVELLSGNEVDLVLHHIPRSRQPFEKRPDWSLLVELGATDATINLKQALEDWLGDRFEEGGISDAFVAQSETQAADIWHVRHSVSEANKLHGHSLSHDVAVRPAMVPAMIERCSETVCRLYPSARILIVSHIGDGNVHFIVHFTHAEWAALSDQADVALQIMTLVHDEVEMLGGTFSAEHGIGRKLVGELARRTDPVRMNLMRSVRKLIDPDGRMNPGVIFER